MYQNFREEFDLQIESISHYSWPVYDDNLIDEKLEQDIELGKFIIQASLNAREKSKIGLRWPVSEIVIESLDEGVKDAVERLEDVIKKQVNCKNIQIVGHFENAPTKILVDKGKIGKTFGALSSKVLAKIEQDENEVLNQITTKQKYNTTVGDKEITLTKDMFTFSRNIEEPYVDSIAKNIWVFVNTERSEELLNEGFSREITRQIQSARKNAGLQKDDTVKLWLNVSEKMKERLRQFKEEIRRKVGADEFLISSEKSTNEYSHSEEFSVKGEKCWVGFNQVK